MGEYIDVYHILQGEPKIFSTLAFFCSKKHMCISRKIRIRALISIFCHFIKNVISRRSKNGGNAKRRSTGGDTRNPNTLRLLRRATTAPLSLFPSLHLHLSLSLFSDVPAVEYRGSAPVEHSDENVRTTLLSPSWRYIYSDLDVGFVDGGGVGRESCFEKMGFSRFRNRQGRDEDQGYIYRTPSRAVYSNALYSNKRDVKNSTVLSIHHTGEMRGQRIEIKCQ
mmetsp:Transcript_437/g.692  ORF Transcript_437/g.692 Transcript_437/m.692 type:complete len:223 (-) Transcript_437:159-827(-)